MLRGGGERKREGKLKGGGKVIFHTKILGNFEFVKEFIMLGKKTFAVLLLMDIVITLWSGR